VLTLGAGTQGLLNFTVSGQGQCNVTGSSANGALLIGPAANAGGGMTAIATFLALIVVWLAIVRLRHARRWR
jgi:hypothetical protein